MARFSEVKLCSYRPVGKAPERSGERPLESSGKRPLVRLGERYSREFG